jgi:hypothetical protein
MAAWMLGLSTMDRLVHEKEPRGDVGPMDGTIPPENAELVNVLACMVLHHGKEAIGGDTGRS